MRLAQRRETRIFNLSRFKTKMPITQSIGGMPVLLMAWDQLLFTALVPSGIILFYEVVPHGYQHTLGLIPGKDEMDKFHEASSQEVTKGLEHSSSWNSGNDNEFRCRIVTKLARGRIYEIDTGVDVLPKEARAANPD
ncbi:hypothetical protein N7527_012189 [Penicillium freii]|nr:hypothetical protein N7527_012189 [Penicillium freii]